MRRNTGEWEAIPTGEYQRAVIAAAKSNTTLGPGAWAGIIGVGISTVALALTIGGQLYQTKADGARAEAKLEATVKAHDMLAVDVKETLKLIATQVNNLNAKVDRLDVKKGK
jgi:hypothetical protein